MTVGSDVKTVRVLFLSDHLGHASGRIHGATSYFLSVLPKLNDSTLCVSACFLRGYHTAAESLKEEGITPIFLNRAKWDISVVVALANLIRENRIDIVHASGMKGILAGRCAAAQCGVKCIAHLHDMVEQSFPIRLLMQLTARWDHRVLVISDAVGAYAASRFHSATAKIETLYNGIDTTRFVPSTPEEERGLKQSLAIPENAPIIINIGRLDALKNQSAAIHMMHKLLSSFPSAVLLMVGAGPTEQDLKTLAHDLSAKCIRFLGQRTDVAALLSISDIMLITSKSEGLGLSAIEALAAGVPVVCPRIGGLPEVIEHGVCGYLTRPDDEREMLDCLVTLLTDKETHSAFSAAARKRANRFDINRHVCRLKAVYSNVINGRQ